jgi:glutaredoxin
VALGGRSFQTERVQFGRRILGASAVWLAVACGNPPQAAHTGQAEVPQTLEQVVAAGEPATPSFEVRDGAEGLLLVWYDAEGQAHTARSRDEIPEAQRHPVRVDSLSVAPDKRLDPAFVYVADLRTPQADGQYSVRKVSRDALERALSRSAPSEAVAQARSDVIIYGASWCGACRQAAGYLRKKGVPFVEKDIEKEPEARKEMLTKAQKQGVKTSGIPVIDVYGTLLGGFDPRRIDALLATK